MSGASRSPRAPVDTAQLDLFGAGDSGPAPPEARGAAQPSADARRPVGPALAHLPDVRDGLTRLERVILYTLAETQRELGDRNVPTTMLYGRVCERLDVSVDRFQRALQRLTGHGWG